MKITTITISDKRPDFIELQYESIRKYIQDQDVEYIVLNNAVNNEGLRKNIDDACESIHVKCVHVVLESEYRVQKQGGCYSGNSYTNVQAACSYPLNWFWKDICKLKGIVVIIDSDMFFIKDINIEKMMNGKDIAFCPQYRAEFKVFYMWNGIVFLNIDTIPNPKTIDWSFGAIMGDSTDVGGHTYFYLKNNNKEIDILFLEFWGLLDFEIRSDSIYFYTSLNGNILWDIIVNQDWKIISFEKKDISVSDNKMLPYETEREDYPQYAADQVKGIYKFLIDNKINLPKPVFSDLIKIQDTDIRESFIFHYKSGSNYQTFYTAEYNIHKTNELKKIICRGAV